MATTDADELFQSHLTVLLGDLPPGPLEVLVFSGREWDHSKFSKERVRFQTLPGESIFGLRARACQEALGDVLVFTEDHCAVEPGWISAHWNFHRDHPDVHFAGGPILNGSTKPVMAEANFLAVFACFLSEEAFKTSGRCPVVASCSFKRGILAAYGGETAELEYRLLPSIPRDRMAFIPAAAVKHFQWHGTWNTIAAHFHNGRSGAGIEKAKFSLSRTIRHCRILFKEALRSMDVSGWQHPQPRLVKFCLATLILSHGVGLWFGSHFGEGSSPSYLE